MKTIFATFCFTSLMWCGAALYGFASGHLERHQPDYLEMQQQATTAAPVHLSHRG